MPFTLHLFVFALLMSSTAAAAENYDCKQNQQAWLNDTATSSRASSVLSYQEFLINEASYKFWAVFQLVTVAVLLYSTFAAIYFARYQYLMNVEAGNYDDLLFARNFPNSNRQLALDIRTVETIINSVFADNYGD